MPGLRRCPWSQITPETWAVLNWWSEWRALQVLPYGGSDLMEQPAYVVEGIQKCETVRVSVETESAHDRERKAQQHIKKQQRGLSQIGRK